jgi:hypothetical protein
VTPSAAAARSSGKAQKSPQLRNGSCHCSTESSALCSSPPERTSAVAPLSSSRLRSSSINVDSSTAGCSGKVAEHALTRPGETLTAVAAIDAESSPPLISTPVRPAGAMRRWTATRRVASTRRARSSRALGAARKRGDQYCSSLAPSRLRRIAAPGFNRRIP